MHFQLPSSRRPRHPIARVLSLLVGVAVIGVLMLFGLVVAGVLLVGGSVLLACRYWTRGRAINQPAAAQNAHQPQTLEGEFVVLRQGRPVHH